MYVHNKAEERKHTSEKGGKNWNICWAQIADAFKYLFERVCCLRAARRELGDSEKARFITWLYYISIIMFIPLVI